MRGCLQAIGFAVVAIVVAGILVNVANEASENAGTPSSRAVVANESSTRTAPVQRDRTATARTYARRTPPVNADAHFHTAASDTAANPNGGANIYAEANDLRCSVRRHPAVDCREVRHNN